MSDQINVQNGEYADSVQFGTFSAWIEFRGTMTLNQSDILKLILGYILDYSGNRYEFQVMDVETCDNEGNATFLYKKV